MPKLPPHVFVTVEPTVAPPFWPEGEVYIEFYDARGVDIAGFSTVPGKLSKTWLEPQILRYVMNEWIDQQGAEAGWQFFIRHITDKDQARVTIKRRMRAIPQAARSWAAPPKKTKTKKSRRR